MESVSGVIFNLSPAGASLLREVGTNSSLLFDTSSAASTLEGTGLLCTLVKKTEERMDCRDQITPKTMFKTFEMGQVKTSWEKS
jgi:hypothetical protein